MQKPGLHFSNFFSHEKKVPHICNPFTSQWGFFVASDTRKGPQREPLSCVQTWLVILSDTRVQLVGPSQRLNTLFRVEHQVPAFPGSLQILKGRWESSSTATSIWGEHSGGFERNHNTNPFTCRSGIVMLTQPLLTMRIFLTPIWQRLSAWEEHWARIDLFRVRARSLEMEISKGNWRSSEVADYI